MKIYRFVSTIKAKDPKDKQPTHYLVAKQDQTTEKGEFVASLWAKEYKNKDGESVKFLSGQMKETWTDHTDKSKSRKGYVIVEEDELNKLISGAKIKDEPKTNIYEDDIPPF